MDIRFFNPLLWYGGERVNPFYNFDTEVVEFDGKRAELSAKRQCGYEFFKEELASGILVSRTLLGGACTVRKDDDEIYKIFAHKRTYDTILDYAKLRNVRYPYTSFADPGTWTFVNHLKLPDYLYDTGDLINYYNDLQYDLAGSVDWPIIEKICIKDENGKRKFVQLDLKTKEMRRNLTLELAQGFINECNKRKNLQFVPFGTIQGYSEETYRDSLRVLLKMGYKYIAIGGLPAYSEKTVLELLPMIWEEVKRSGDRPGIHLYGRFPSPQYVPQYLKYGVTSFDNNSGFISASTASCSYYDPQFKIDGEIPVGNCSGIKIPPVTGPLLRKIKKNNPDVYKRVEFWCSQTFKMFCEFVRTESKIDAKKFLIHYKRMNREMQKANANAYSANKIKTLMNACKVAIKEKGWNKCKCTSCRKLKGHVNLVRGQRIPYLFLHNSHVQYYRFVKELEKAVKTTEFEKFDWNLVDQLHRKKHLRKSIRG